MITSIGDQVQYGEYLLHSRFERAVNFVAENRFVSAVTEEIGAGPDHVVTTDLRPFFCEDRLQLTPEMLQGVRRFNSTLPLLNLQDERVQKGLRLFEGQLLKTAPEKSLAVLLAPERESEFRGGFEQKVLGRMREALGRALQGKFQEGFSAARGVGWGLTPCGDDWIAGVLMGLRVQGIAFDWSPRTTDPAHHFSRSPSSQMTDFLLKRTSQGLICERWKTMLQSLSTADEAAIGRALKRVLEIGATSGADTATGVIVGLRNKREPMPCT